MYNFEYIETLIKKNNLGKLLNLLSNNIHNWSKDNWLNVFSTINRHGHFNFLKSISKINNVFKNNFNCIVGLAVFKNDKRYLFSNIIYNDKTIYNDNSSVNVNVNSDFYKYLFSNGYIATCHDETRDKILPQTRCSNFDNKTLLENIKYLFSKDIQKYFRHKNKNDKIPYFYFCFTHSSMIIPFNIPCYVTNCYIYTNSRIITLLSKYMDRKYMILYDKDRHKLPNNYVFIVQKNSLYYNIDKNTIDYIINKLSKLHDPYLFIPKLTYYSMKNYNDFDDIHYSPLYYFFVENQHVLKYIEDKDIIRCIRSYKFNSIPRHIRKKIFDINNLDKRIVQLLVYYGLWNK